MKSFHFARIPRNPGHSVENFRPIVIKLVSYRRTIFKTKLSKNHLIVKVRYEFVLLHLLRYGEGLSSKHRWGREDVKTAQGRPRALSAGHLRLRLRRAQAIFPNPHLASDQDLPVALPLPLGRTPSSCHDLASAHLPNSWTTF